MDLGRVRGPKITVLPLLCLLVVSLALAGCATGDPTASQAESNANDFPGEQIYAAGDETGFLSREEGAAETYVRAVARSMSKGGIRGFGYAECTKNPCLVTVEGLLKGPSSSLGYECETAVMVNLRGARATVRRETPFSCREVQSLLD